MLPFLKDRPILRLLAVSVLVLGAAATTGCPSAEEQKEAERQELIRRAQAFWNAKADKDFEGSYPFLEPEWKARLPVPEWASSFNLVDWENPEVLDAKIEDSLGIVKVRFDYELLGTFASGEKGETVAHEYWVKVGEVWYKEEPGIMETPSWEDFPAREAAP